MIGQHCDYQKGHHRVTGIEASSLPALTPFHKDDKDICSLGLACVPLATKQVHNVTGPDGVVQKVSYDHVEGICIPCMNGMHCAVGTVSQSISTWENLCPPGELCEGPWQSRVWRVSSFCLSNSMLLSLSISPTPTHTTHTRLRFATTAHSLRRAQFPSLTHDPLAPMCRFALQPRRNVLPRRHLH